MKVKTNRYKVHYILGLTLLPFLLISAFTGFFRANHQWFFKEDYKKFKNFSYETKLTKPAVSVDSVFNILKNNVDKDISISEIKLKREIGKLLYDVKVKNSNAILIDADRGEILSPITEELGKSFSQQYVKPYLKIKSIFVNDNYKTRKEKKIRPVYIIEYADDLNTKIFIDKNNGEIEEEEDKNLRFGFWMVKFHDYDFWTAKRIILSIVGAGLFMLGSTGLYLWLRKKRRRSI